MSSLLLIPARMQSQRLPDKPLREIHGKPMLLHVYERATQAACGPVYVVTGDEVIETFMHEQGGDVIRTEHAHMTGSDRIYEAWQSLPQAEQYDIIVCVQGDLPNLDPALVQEVVAHARQPEVDVATLACVSHDEEEFHNPNVVKVVLGKQEASGAFRALYFSRAAIPHGKGPHIHHIGIYAYKAEALKRYVALQQSPLEKQERLEQLRALEAGMVIMVGLVNTAPLSVDTKEDLIMVEQQMKESLHG
jgi:3-deoxy-manno-octulosonate cytidylyltransferase (CMP-KDO synthetase)